MAVSTEPRQVQEGRRHTGEAIKATARKLHIDLWTRRAEFWRTLPIEVIDAEKAIELIGYRLKMSDGLGFRQARKGQQEVAGLIDRTGRVIRLSRQFPGPSIAFTLAHELGHAVLHPEGGGIHRDRSRDRSGASTSPTEFEADRFAVHFLMPERVVCERFEDRFGVAPFVLNDETAFALRMKNLDVAIVDEFHLDTHGLQFVEKLTLLDRCLHHALLIISSCASRLARPSGVSIRTSKLIHIHFVFVTQKTISAAGV